MKKKQLKEILEPREKTRLETVGIPALIPAVSAGFGVVVRLAGATWQKWYRVFDQPGYEEVLASAKSSSVRVHDIHLYSISV